MAFLYGLRSLLSLLCVSFLLISIDNFTLRLTAIEASDEVTVKSEDRNKFRGNQQSSLSHSVRLASPQSTLNSLSLTLFMDLI
jgi:hypothetical protein